MDKELVEMRLRIYSENVTFSTFLLLLRAILSSPAEPGPKLLNFHESAYCPNAKSPQHQMLRAFCGFESSYFFCVFTVLPEGLSLISVSFFFSSRLVAGSVCLGVLTGVLAMMKRCNW
jgi:hypothetical protein